MSANISDDQLEIIQEFVTESRDMIDQLEPTIIELSQDCSNPDIETINSIFRLFHSMKGSAGFLEFDNIAHVTHAAENLLDLVRSGDIELIPDHVQLLIATCDFSKDALDKVDEEYVDTGIKDDADTLANQLTQAIAVAKGEAPAEAATEEPPTEVAAEEEVAETPAKKETAETPAVDAAPEMMISGDMVERFVQEAEELLQKAEDDLLAWEKEPENEEVIHNLFRNIHSFKGNCGFFGYSELEKLSHQLENVLDQVKSGKPINSDKPADDLLPVVDALKDGVARLAAGDAPEVPELPELVDVLLHLIEASEPPQLLGEYLVEEGVKSEAIDKALETQRKPVGELLVDMGEATPEKVEKALEKQAKTQPQPAQKPAAGAPAAKPKAPARQDIRVDLTKLDSLINLIGELVIAENMLIHNPDLRGLELENFTKAGQHMSKLVRELQEMAMTIRMIPVAGLFRRMIRLVHDISNKAGKKVDLQLVGEETEIDKTVIETISDPLVHLLRNALDHGLETPDERVAAGKPEKGVLKLSARHEEGEVWVTVEEDGRGLPREKILEKAIKNGLIEGDGSELSDREVHHLIFAPGFSTAASITDISGRGVGMDVVKRNLEKIKGKIDIRSKEGQGTRFDLRIPLTLAIIDGMMVRVGASTCIVPTLSICEAFRPEEENITITPDGTELVKVREEFYPIVRLHEVLDKEPDSREVIDGILIVLEHSDRRAALFVDEILGQQQTVIKGLSNFIGNVTGISGCTILGDGEVSLILDVGSLVEMSEGQENNENLSA